MEIKMHYILAISTIILCIGIIMLIINIIKSQETIYAILIIGVAVVFGFGILASVIPVKLERQLIEDYEVAFTSTTVTIAFNDYAELLYDIKSYNILKDKENCQVYYVVKVNSYGFQIETAELIIDKKY